MARPSGAPPDDRRGDWFLDRGRGAGPARRTPREVGRGPNRPGHPLRSSHGRGRAGGSGRHHRRRAPGGPRPRIGQPRGPHRVHLLLLLPPQRRHHIGEVAGRGGLGLLGASGYLGGHLAFRMGSGVDRTAFDHKPQDGPRSWRRGPVRGLPAGGAVRRHRRAALPELRERFRDPQRVHTPGRPAERGVDRPEARTVTCPWHASEFDLCTGEVIHGPPALHNPDSRPGFMGERSSSKKSKGVSHP